MFRCSLVVAFALCLVGHLCAAPLAPEISDPERGYSYAPPDPSWSAQLSAPGRVAIRSSSGEFSANLIVSPNVMQQRVADHAAASLNAWRQRLGASFRLIRSSPARILDRPGHRLDLEGTENGRFSRIRVAYLENAPLIVRLTIVTSLAADALDGLEERVRSGLKLSAPSVVAPQFWPDESVYKQAVATPTARAWLHLDAALRTLHVTAEMEVERTKGPLSDVSFALMGPVAVKSVTLDGLAARLEDGGHRAVFPAAGFAPGQIRKLRAEYEIRAGSELAQQFSAFFLAVNGEDAFVQYDWLPIAGPVRPYGVNPGRSSLRVDLTATPGWTGLAPGSPVDVPHGRAFVLGDPATIAPLVTFGRYREQVVHTPHGPVHVALRPSDPDTHVPQLAADVGEAFAFFERTYGPAGARLPMRLVSSSFSAIRGLPYFILAGTGADLWKHPPLAPRAIDASTNFSTALLFHECSHTWWGNRVQVEPDAMVFLLEGLANFSALHAVRQLHGEALHGEMRRHVVAGYRAIVTTGADAPLHPGVGYRTELAYTKGALVLEAMAHAAGMETFLRGLRAFSVASGEAPGSLDDLLTRALSGSGVTPADARARWLSVGPLPSLFEKR